MSAFDRLTVYQTMLSSGVVPLFYHPDLETSRQAVAACVEGGAAVMEFTNRGEGALAVFAGLLAHFRKANPKLILGIGSIVDAPTAALALSYGADFIVAPNFNPEVARLCNRRKIAYLPGCATPTEIATAEEAGAEIVKIFPPSPELIKAVLGPMPWSRLMPSGGVDVKADNVDKWIKAGAACLGIGSNLINPKLLAAGNYATISEGVSLAAASSLQAAATLAAS
jgi:2-dehydro-3-deoxyphosphogluconate aldolase/(4S)-4-hydroxy-2-oxoglutarate aldolase